jgi:diphosphomevalonate decarboxylase
VKDFHLMIDTDNSFPHSSGIASSASAMSALALCIAELQVTVDGDTHDERFQREVSIMARLGSGSACRSVYGPVCLWGSTPMMPGSSDEYAIPLPNIHPVFQTLRDSILIISEEKKQVSSSAGHGLMQGHQFASARIAQATQNLKMLLPALHSGDIVTFGRIAEAEALSLHALMMTSDPAYILIQPNTLQVIQRTKAFRESSGIPVYFTLDAGPNVHLLFPESHEAQVKAWINEELVAFCENGRVIHDHAGGGPRRLEGEKART